MLKLAVVLIAAHAIADFSLQTEKIVRQKDRFSFLSLHGLMHALTTYVILQSWFCWQIPLAICLVHMLIDFFKQSWGKESVPAFVIDQFLHLLSLIVLAWALTRFAGMITFTGRGYKPIVTLAGFLTTVQGAGYVIALFIKKLMDENQLQLDGLVNGGKLIGQLERALIFLLVLIDQPAGIGFLVAAKSILRFEEAKQQKMAEYVLIGTLLSFSLAMAVAWSTKWAAAL